MAWQAWPQVSEVPPQLHVQDAAVQPDWAPLKQGTSLQESVPPAAVQLALSLFDKLVLPQIDCGLPQSCGQLQTFSPAAELQIPSPHFTHRKLAGMRAYCDLTQAPFCTDSLPPPMYGVNPEQQVVGKFILAGDAGAIIDWPSAAHFF